MPKTRVLLGSVPGFTMARDSNKANYFSEKTGWFYQLLPTKTVPALRINAVPMHRFAKIDPKEHTRRIIEASNPHGKVLDICTGLGYIAIQSANRKEVLEVITIEKDSEVLEMAKINPASAELFKNLKIKIVEGDATLEIQKLESAHFDCVICDPPTYVMAPELYSKVFMGDILRVLKKGGTLWFYSASPGKAGGGSSNLAQRIVKNLGIAGFSELKEDKSSTGVVGKKV